MAAPVAVAFGGSILAPADPDPGFLDQVAKRLVAWSHGRPLLVSVGGGAPARRAIQLARGLGVAERELDRIGIQATRLNAQVLAGILAHHGARVNVRIPDSVEQAAALLGDHRIVVMGGTTPGHSTDYVATTLALEAGAQRLVIATSVDGVYTMDPREHAEATRIETLSFEALADIVGDPTWRHAGAPGVIDGPATVLLRRHRLETRVVHGTDLEALAAAVEGRPGHGTLIRDEPVEDA